MLAGCGSGSGGAGGPTPGQLPDLGSSGLTPTDTCPDFHGLQLMADGPWAALTRSIANDPVDPNSAILLQAVWYDPGTAPAGWDANGQLPAALGGTYLAGYAVQHLWPQGDMPFQVADSTSLVTESGPQQDSQFFVYGGTTANPPYAYLWNDQLTLENVHGAPDDQRDLAECIVPWTASPPAPPSPWAGLTTSVSGVAPGTVANRVEIGTYANGTLEGVRFWKAQSDAGTHVAYAWNQAGTLLGQAAFTGETASGWQYAWFAPAIPVAQFTPCLVGVSFSQGTWTATSGALAATFASGGALELPADTVAAPNGLTGAATDGIVPASASHQTYFWVDPIVRMSEDHHALVYDRATNTCYEAYNAYRKSSGIEFPFDTSGQNTTWRAGGGAGIFDLTHGPLNPMLDPGTSTAGGLPIIPLLLRFDEVKRALTSGPGGGPGDVGHAIRMTSVGIASMTVPPSRTVAWSGRSDGMPYGARVRIKASWLAASTLDPQHQVSNYHFFDAHPQAQVILNTLANYGAVMDDGGLMFQLSNSPIGADPWDGPVGISNTALDLLFHDVKGDAFEIAQLSPGYTLTASGSPQAKQPLPLTIALQPAGDVDRALDFWLTDGSDGTFVPNPVPLPAGQTSVQVSYTPGSSGTKLLRALALRNATQLSVRWPPGGPAGLGPAWFVTSLAQGIDAAATALAVSASGNPYNSDWNLPFWVIIDDEILRVTAVAGGVNWTVARAGRPFGGVPGVAAPHAAGAKVAMAAAATGTGPGYTPYFFPYVLDPALTLQVP